MVSPSVRLAIAALIWPVACATAADPAAEIPLDKRKEIVDAIVAKAAQRPAQRRAVAETKLALEQAAAGVVDKSKKQIVVPAKIDKGTPIRFPSAAAKDEYVKDLETKLARLSDRVRGADDKPESYAPEIILNSPASYGVFSAQVVTVDSVIDKQSALVKTRTETFDRPLGGQPITVLVAGFDTGKYADNLKAASPAGIFYVAGTKRVSGVTVFHLVALTFTEPELKRLKEAIAQEK